MIESQVDELTCCRRHQFACSNTALHAKNSPWINVQVDDSPVVNMHQSLANRYSSCTHRNKQGKVGSWCMALVGCPIVSDSMKYEAFLVAYAPSSVQ
jgi:hypothetical protein